MNRDRIKQLIAILKTSSAQELSVDDGQQMVRIRRRAGQVGAAAQARPSSAQTPASPAAGEVAEESTTAVRANLVGLFYRGKGAGAEPLVEMGDQVKEGQVVGTIDALRQLTEVLSPAAGEVVEIVAQDGEAVQYGQVLMRLTPSEGRHSDGSPTSSAV